MDILKESSKGSLYKKTVTDSKDVQDVLNALNDQGSKGISSGKIKSFIEQQSEYWEEIIKDKEFAKSVERWRDIFSPGDRESIDAFIIKHPPPSIKISGYVWRGLGMDEKSYRKFVDSIKDKTELTLPPSSFSFDVSVATDRADTRHSVVIAVKSECGKLNALALASLPGVKSLYEEAESELILPSNSRYRIESIRELQDNFGDNITVVKLLQKCS